MTSRSNAWGRDAIDGIRMRYAGIAVGTVDSEGTAITLEAGRDDLREDSVFEFGSVTKTMTGLILATAVTRRELALETTVGDVLGPAASAASAITLVQLATHTAGLPRTAPNFRSAIDDPGDPFARYDAERLLESLQQITPDVARSEYSNFGYQILGYLIERALGRTLPDLFRERIFQPLGMDTCGVQQDPVHTPGILPGYRAGSLVPHWHLPLAGPGGVTGTIGDLVRYVGIHCGASAHEDLDEAVRVATTIHARGPDAPMGLAWMQVKETFIHGGQTAGFKTFIGFHQPTRTAVAVAVNSGTADVAVNAHGSRLLNEMVRQRGPTGGEAS